MSAIKIIYAREILDSRGLPTVECQIWLDDGTYVSSSVPSGTSTSKMEVFELRDNDPNRMAGHGVYKAVNNVNNIIAPALIGKDPINQTEIDQIVIDLDGTKNKSKLGANAILSVSQAVAKAAAVSQGLPLYKYLQQKYQMAQELKIPTVIYGIINGGEHGADNLDIQEFQIIPASHIPFSESLSIAVSLFQKLQEVLISKDAIHSVGIVGGFAPNLYNNMDAFEILIETIKATPYTFAQDVFFGVDVEAATFFEGGKYNLKDKSQPNDTQDMMNYYKNLRQQYHVFYIEDPFEETDFKSWSQLTSEIGDTTTIAADTLASTNPEQIKKAIKQKACNAIVIKPNQVGTISEAINSLKLAKDAKMTTICSHRSGETNDDFIADFSVGLGFDYARFGPPNRGERVAKYNRFLQIESQLKRSQPST